MIARADSGGLGNLTREFARHMKPDRVLIMDLGEYGRSAVYLERYAGFDTRVCHGVHLNDVDAEWLFEGSDVIYTAETAYRDDFWVMARQRGVKTVLHSMPELHRPTMTPDMLWLPTVYEKRRFEARGISFHVVPVPVALDRFRDVSPKPGVFYHQGSPAMRDRNGTDIVVSALSEVTEPCKMVFLCRPGLPVPERIGVVDIEVVQNYPLEYWDAHAVEGSVLVLPRRYAGLSMPMQEALAGGRPVISTALEPQMFMGGVMTIPVKKGRPDRVPMAGGTFDVWDVMPGSLADAITTMARNPAFVAEMAREAKDYAISISWDVWECRYRTMLDYLIGQ